MKDKSTRILMWRSLRVQLLVGATLLLAITVAGVGYALTINQRRSLTQAMIQTVVLQGRNVALSGEKSILRADPEFELCPLVTRMMTQVPDIGSLVVVDRENRIQGHSDPSQVGELFPSVRPGARLARTAGVRADETLHETDNAYVFATPILNGGNPVGMVYVDYSKRALLEEQARAMSLTIRLSAAALLAGLLMSLWYFSRISRPMRVLMRGLDSLGSDLSFSIEMPTRDEFGVLAGAFNRMAGQIRQAQHDLLARERLAHEIELARQIQESLIPNHVDDASRFQIGYHYESAYEVGGDCLDIIPIDRSRVFFLLADVSGKGVPGMVVMAMTRALVRQIARDSSSPREVLIRLNDALSGNIRRGMFVTAFAGLLDTESGELSYSNAGHNPPILFQGDSRTAVATRLPGVPLGLFGPEQFAPSVADHTLRLRTGDLTLLYTDGLVESANESQEQLTLQRVTDLVSRHAPAGARQLVQVLVKEEKKFRGDAPQRDDITLLAFGIPARESSPVVA